MSDGVISTETTKRMHSEFSDLFTDIECFKGTFFLKVKDNTKLH